MQCNDIKRSYLPSVSSLFQTLRTMTRFGEMRTCPRYVGKITKSFHGNFVKETSARFSAARADKDENYYLR